MNKTWKKQVFIVTLAVFICAALLLYELFQVDPVLIDTGFVFIFIAYITLFPLIITRERPRQNRDFYTFQLRAPPLY